MTTRNFLVLIVLPIPFIGGIVFSWQTAHENVRLQAEVEVLRRENMNLGARVMMYDYALKHPEEGLRPVAKEAAR